MAKAKSTDIIRAMCSQVEARHKRLTGLQKAFILNYLEGATCSYQGKMGMKGIEFHQCMVTLSVSMAQESGALPMDFGEGDLLQWAAGPGDVCLSAAGIEAARRLGIFGAAGPGPTQANTAGRDGVPGKKPGASADVQKLRDKLYSARQTHILKAGAYTAESWTTWIPKFIKGLRPKSLLNADVKLQYRDKCKAGELDAKGWAALYKQEYYQRHKKTRG